MSAHEATPDEVEALSNLLPLGYEARDRDRNVFEASERILASDWLAQRDARIKAEALREAADEHLIDFGAWDPQKSHRPGGVADWLRARADRIEAQR